MQAVPAPPPPAPLEVPHGADPPPPPPLRNTAILSVFGVIVLIILFGVYEPGVDLMLEQIA